MTTKEEVQDAYDTMRPKVAAAYLGVNIHNFYKLLDKHGIKRKREPRPRK